MNRKWSGRLGALCIVLCLTLLGGISPLGAQEVGAELLPEGAEISEEASEALEELYTEFANSLGMSFEEAREMGLTITDLQRMDDEAAIAGRSQSVDRPVEPEAAASASSGVSNSSVASSSSTLPSRAERGLIRALLAVVLAVLVGGLNGVRGFFARRSSERMV